MPISHEEDKIQAAVVAHLKQRGVLGLVFFHVPNSSKLGGKRTKDGIPLAAIRGKKLGVRAGVSDLILVHGGKIYALELKTNKGKPSESQLQFISDLTAQGAECFVAQGLDAALAVLKRWGLIR